VGGGSSLTCIDRCVRANPHVVVVDDRRRERLSVSLSVRKRAASMRICS
jgi:hypothetical protein